MPRWRRASTPSGINPSPHGLSIGGTAPSATTTLKPWRRAAIAVAKPAGPPPATNTSHGLEKWAFTKLLGDEVEMRDVALTPPTTPAKQIPSRTPDPLRLAGRAC